MGVLTGLRVLELAEWVAGPFAASLLGDFGAEVIRIDLPGQVANSRTLGGLEPEDGERSPFFAILSHNKKSVTLDVRTPPGREVFLRLIERSDVLVEGFRPGTLERWGLGWDTLRETNPSLVVLRISGFGQTGPLSARPGLDRVAQAFAGAMHLTGEEGGRPVRCGVAIADYAAGLWGVYGVMLALYAAERTGRREGQVIDQPLYQAILPMLWDKPLRYQRYRELPERTGNRIPGVAPGDTYRTVDDRWVQISASGQVAFQRLAAAMGRPELVDDPRFGSPVTRDEWHAELGGEVAGWVATLSADEVEQALDAVGVAACRVHNIDELMQHPHVRARDDFVTLHDPVFGELPAFGVMPRLSATPGAVLTPAPRIGEHNSEIFGDLLGLSDAELERLRDAGAL